MINIKNANVTIGKSGNVWFLTANYDDQDYDTLILLRKGTYLSNEFAPGKILYNLNGYFLRLF